MRKITVGLFTSVLFFSSAAFALADVTPLNFYCAPYTSTFADGQAYTPADHQSSGCTFGFASNTPTSGDTTYIIYRGTPGANPEFINYTVNNNDTEPFSLGDVVFSGSGANVPGEAFFAASFKQSDGGLGAWDNFFKNGGDAPGDYSIKIWNYGAPVTVTADNKNMTAGSAVPALTATISGFISPDTGTSNDITGAASCTTTATSASPVGDYPITCTQGTLSSGKYAFAGYIASLDDTTLTSPYVAGTLHISAPAPVRTPLTVTAANKTMQASSSVPALTVTLSGFVSPDTASSSDVTGQAACTTTATSASAAGNYPITCTVGTLVSAAHYTFGPFVAGTLTVTPKPVTDVTPPTIVITSPINNGIYAKTDTNVHVTATITDQSAIATTTYWFNGIKINPANALPLANAPVVSKVSVSAKDVYGNTATSTITIYIVKSTNSCLLDIIAILTAISKDKTLPDKPTIINLIADCSALLKGYHRDDDDGHGHHSYH